MISNFESKQWRQLRLQQFAGEIVRHNVRRDEYFELLLSRRPLERCDDESAQCRGLLDRRSGDLFDIDEVDLNSPA